MMTVSGRSHSSSSEASTPETPTADSRHPPPFLRTISEGTYSTLDNDSLSSSSSFALNFSSLDSQDAAVNDASRKLRESLDLNSVDIVNPIWSPSDGTDRTDSAVQNAGAKPEGIQSEDSTSNTLSSFSRSQASSSVGDLECTQL